MILLMQLAIRILILLTKSFEWAIKLEKPSKLSSKKVKCLC